MTARGLHDVTTDLLDPPPFVQVLPHRRWALNPPEYDGPEAAALQRQFHPDIAPLVVAEARDDVLDAVRRLVAARGWHTVGEAAGTGESRLEAVAITSWLRFRDDVVIRLRDVPGGTRVDVRSKSRIGGSDFGTNARRVRGFLRDLVSGRSQTP